MTTYYKPRSLGMTRRRIEHDRATRENAALRFYNGRINKYVNASIYAIVAYLILTLFVSAFVFKDIAENNAGVTFTKCEK
jgi:hypothetical protein